MRHRKSSVQGTVSAEGVALLGLVGIVGMAGLGLVGGAMQTSINDESAGSSYALAHGAGHGGMALGPSAQAGEGDGAAGDGTGSDAASVAAGAPTSTQAGTADDAAAAGEGAAAGDPEGTEPHDTAAAHANGEATAVGRYGEMPPPERTGPGVGSFLKRLALLTPLAWFKKDTRDASFTMWKSAWHALEELPALMGSFMFEMIPNMVYHGRWDQLWTFAKSFPPLIYEGMKYDLDAFKNGSPEQAGRAAGYMVLDYAPITWHMGKFASRKMLLGTKLMKGGEAAEGLSHASRMRAAKLHLNAALLADIGIQRGKAFLDERAPGLSSKLSQRASALRDTALSIRTRAAESAAARLEAAQTRLDASRVTSAAAEQADTASAVIEATGAVTP